MKAVKKVLVAGASGYLGHYMVRALKAKSYWVRVLVRSEKQKKLFMKQVDEVILGEVTKPETLVGICKGIDWVFTSIGITRQKDNLTYMDVDFQGNVNLLNEAQSEKVEKFLYVSVFLTTGMAHLKIIQAKELFVAKLLSSDLQALVVRPNGYFSDLEEYYKMAEFGVAVLGGAGNFRLNPISGEDLANFCLNQLESNTIGEVEVGGPNILTHRKIADICFKEVGKRARYLYVPVWMLRFAAFLISKITSVKFYGPIEFFLTVSTRDFIAPKFGTLTFAQHIANLHRQEIEESRRE